MYNFHDPESLFLWFSHLPIFAPCALHILQLCLRWSLTAVLGKYYKRNLKVLYLSMKRLRTSYGLVLQGLRKLVATVQPCKEHRDKIALKALWMCFRLTEMQLAEIVFLELCWDGKDLWVYCVSWGIQYSTKDFCELVCD